MSLNMFQVCTYNARSLLSRAQLAVFVEEANKIRFDIIGLAEVRRRGSGRVDLPNGAALFHAGHDDRSNGWCRILRLECQSKTTSSGFRSSSARVAELQIKIIRQWEIEKSPRSFKYTLLIQRSGDDEYDAFLDEIAELLNDHRCSHHDRNGRFQRKNWQTLEQRTCRRQLRLW